MVWYCKYSFYEVAEQFLKAAELNYDKHRYLTSRDLPLSYNFSDVGYRKKCGKVANIIQRLPKIVG